MTHTSFIQDRVKNPFMDADGGDLGEESPSIWLFGIEHGINPYGPEKDHDYSYDIQKKFPYNRNAFKLLSAIEGFSLAADTKINPISHNFGKTHQPFAKGSKGYFKGNLFSYACSDVSSWDQKAEAITGFKEKQLYYKEYRKLVFPEVYKQATRYRPRLIIGVGTTFKEDFSLAFLNDAGSLFQQKCFEINSHRKNIFYIKNTETKLVVIPHLSGGKNGLNSNAALFEVGSFIRKNILDSVEEEESKKVF